MLGLVYDSEYKWQLNVRDCFFVRMLQKLLNLGVVGDIDKHAILGLVVSKTQQAQNETHFREESGPWD